MSVAEHLNGFRAVAPIRFHTHRVSFNCPRTNSRRKFLLWVDDGYTIEGTRVVLDLARAYSADGGKKESSPFVRGEHDPDAEVLLGGPSPR